MIKYLSFVSIFLVLSCNIKTGTYNEEYSISEQSVEIDTLNVIEGEYFLINEDNFFVPNNWDIVENTDSYFKIKSLSNPATTMTVTKVLNSPHRLSLKEFVEKDFKTFYNTGGVELQKYELVHFKFKSQIINNFFSGVYDVEYDDIGNYTNLVHFFLLENYLYAFVLQTPSHYKDKYMTFFSTLVYSYQNNGQLLFSPQNKISSVERVKF